MDILLSIQPKFVERIFKGEKKFEFRSIVPAACDKVYIYETNPVQSIVGYFTFSRIITAKSYQDLWEMTKEFAGISYNEFKAYFASKKEFHAFEIAFVHKFEKPVRLEKTPPQNYYFLTEKEKKEIFEKNKNLRICKYCGKEFYSSYNDHYHSPSCKQKAKREAKEKTISLKFEETLRQGRF